MAVIAASTGQQSDDLRAVSPENKNQCAGLDRQFGSRFQIVQTMPQWLEDCVRACAHHRRQIVAVRNRPSR